MYVFLLYWEMGNRISDRKWIVLHTFRRAKFDRCYAPCLIHPSFGYPLVNIQKTIENGHRNSGFTN